MGDEARSFEQFFADQYPALRRYVARRFGPEHADDIAQETMLRAFGHFHEIDPGRPAERWLATIARRVGIDILRKHHSVSVEHDVLDDLAPAVPDESVAVAARVDVGGLLRTAMAQLSHHDQEVLTLHEVCGVDVRDIATRAGTSQNTIRQRLFRARHNLLRHYRELGGGEYATLPVGSGRPLPKPLRSAVDTANRFAARVQEHLPRERVAAVTAAIAIGATTAVAPVVPPGVRDPARRPAPAIAPVAVPQTAVPDVLTAGGKLLGPLIPQLPSVLPAGNARLPYAEDWDGGLGAWTVTGRSAATDCLPGHQLSTLCSLRLDPPDDDWNDRAEVRRPLGVELRSVIRLTYAVRAPGDGFGTVDLHFDRTTVHVTVDPHVGLIVVEDGRDVERFGALVERPWYQVLVTVYPEGRVEAQQYLSEWTQPLTAMAVDLPEPPGRLAALGLAAARAEPVWFDQIRIEGDLPECSDGRDDDGDGRVDGKDPGCASGLDDSESPDPQCGDGVDNDGDGLVDTDDPGCPFQNSGSESPPCSNGLDDDGDGRADYPEDPKCRAESDESEQPACSNGIDDEDDGTADTADMGCTGPDDDSEWSCAVVHVDSRGAVTVVPDTEPQSKPLSVGVCLDPYARYGPALLAVADAPAPQVRGYLNLYRYAGAEFPCVHPVAGAGSADPCRAFGATLVRRLAALVRAETEVPDGMGGRPLYLCTASAMVVKNGDWNPLDRGEHAVTVC